MDLEVVVDIGADAGRVWEVLVDVEAWPTWTPTMTSVQRVDGGPLAVGSAARIRQPRIGTMIWTVTELTDGRSFTWEAKRPGLRFVAGHLIADAPPNGTRVTLSLHQSGPVGSALAPITGGFARRNVEVESQGLKKRAESSRA
jgi:uncharacterized membrane protein